MEWLVHKFKPEIDSNIRTLPDRDHTFIAGSSMGGLMSLYALMEYNRYFSKAAALSPSLWVDPDRLSYLIRHAKLHADTTLYMDYGSRELYNHTNMIRCLGKITSLLLERQVYVNCRIVPGGNHCEASWERQIPFFMEPFYMTAGKINPGPGSRQKVRFPILADTFGKCLQEEINGSSIF